MSNYRDDTQETMVIADSIFTLVKSDVVENLKIIDKEIANIKVFMSDAISIKDEVRESRSGLFIDDIKIEADVIDKQISKHLIVETLQVFTNTNLVFKATQPITESLFIHDTSSHSIALSLKDNLSISDVFLTKAVLKTSVLEKIKVTDAVVSNNHIFEMIEDTARISEKFSFQLLDILSDSLYFYDSVQHNLFAQALITDHLRIKDNLANINHSLILDSIRVADSVLAQQKYIDHIADNILVSSALLERKRIIEVVDDSVIFDSTLSGKLHAKKKIEDLLFIEDLLPCEHSSGSAWTSGCDSWNMSRYSDFKYTELVIINGELFAVCDTGVYQLTEGAENVSAKIVTPKLDLGAGGLIHPIGAYLEYELSGDAKKLEVAVISTQSGAKQVYYYLLPAEKSNHLTNGRVLFGRGLRGRHFGFEISMYGSKGYINDLSIDISSTKRRV